MLKRFFQLRAMPAATGDAISANRVVPGFFECLDLVLGILVEGQDPGISDALRQTIDWLRQQDSPTSIVDLLQNTILWTLRMLVKHT